MKYKRFCFIIPENGSFYPIKDMKTPWWWTGSASNGSYDRLVCYLLANECIYDYWPDAQINSEEYREKITYSKRFPKPEWIV